MMESILLWYAEGLYCTILIECLVAILLGMRDAKYVARMALIQALTNPFVLSVVLTATSCGMVAESPAYWALVAALESSVVVCEAFLIRALIAEGELGRMRVSNPLALSLTLNLSSYLFGLLMGAVGTLLS